MKFKLVDLFLSDNRKRKKIQKVTVKNIQKVKAMGIIFKQVFVLSFHLNR